PATCRVCRGSTRMTANPRRSSNSNRAIQYTPVASMAMVVTPQANSQSASCSRSGVQVPKARTLAGKFAGWSLGLPGARHAGTQTQCSRACTSMPAACGWAIRRPGSLIEGCGFVAGGLWPDAAAGRASDGFADMIGLPKKAAGAGGLASYQSPKEGHATSAPQGCQGNLPGPSSRRGTRHQVTIGHLDRRPRAGL